MDEKPLRMPPPEKVMSPDPEPVAVEFLAELPDHVRAFFDEQHRGDQRPRWRRWFGRQGDASAAGSST